MTQGANGRNGTAVITGKVVASLQWSSMPGRDTSWRVGNESSFTSLSRDVLRAMSSFKCFFIPPSCHILSFCISRGFRFPLPKVIASAMSAACLALLLLVHHTQVQYSYHKSRMENLRSKLKKNGKRLSRVRYFTKWKGSKSKHDVNLM